MNQAPSTDVDLPDDVVLSVRHVSKKFCRNLRRSMWYGMQDLGRNLLGLRPGRDYRLQTTDYRPEDRVVGVQGADLPQSVVRRLSSVVSPASDLPQSVVRSPLSVVSHSPSSVVPPPPGLPPLRKDEFWALQDINFELRRGETLGLIGLNGSGKTTLLRLLMGIFPPDTGEILIRGRAGGLVALGAGFHPHMTGRENIYLNGSILGLSKSQIEANIEKIIEFANIRDFIDAPVATYSSGMHVRLGFAIASVQEPDLLLLDEVLAVGDAPFRNKCYNHIGNLQKQAAVVLVSHTMEQIAQVCSRALFLERGVMCYQGEVATTIDLYSKAGEVGETDNEAFESVAEPVQSTRVLLSQTAFGYGDTVTLSLAVQSSARISNCSLRVVFYDKQGVIVCEWNSKRLGMSIHIGEGKSMLSISLGPICLACGHYKMGVALLDSTGVYTLIWSFKKLSVTVAGVYGGSCAYQLGA